MAKEGKIGLLFFNPFYLGNPCMGFCFIQITTHGINRVRGENDHTTIFQALHNRFNPPGTWIFRI